jgi:deoxyribonuclease V
MYAELEALLRQVPRGKVTTYGDLAAALGSRSAARWVGEYLREHPHQGDCNCHRVVRVDGDVGLFVSSSEEKIQLLEHESIAVVDGRVDLDRHRFDAFVSTQPLLPLLEFQQTLPEQVALRPFASTPKFVGGVDVAYPSPREAVAAFALVETSSRELVWSTTVRCPVRFPYISGLLGFREVPALLELMAQVAAEQRTPELVIVDGNGILHYRFAGIASHFGVASGLPTIGVGKKLLCGRVDLKGLEPGEQRQVTYADRVVGTAVKSGPHSRPIFISPGHGIDVGDAARLGQLLFAGHRLPEPLYWADALTKQASRAVKQQG